MGLQNFFILALLLFSRNLCCSSNLVDESEDISCVENPYPLYYGDESATAYDPTRLMVESSDDHEVCGVSQTSTNVIDESEGTSCVENPYPLYYGDESATAYDPTRFMVESSDDHEVCGVSQTSTTVIDVVNYGARGDGKTFDGMAFQRAWKSTCSSFASDVILMIPKNKTFLLKPITFSGPCKSNVTVLIMGTIEASSDRSDWDADNRRHWIMFESITDLTIKGGGTINGNGEIWWQNSCKINKSLPCQDAPTALTFYSCNNLMVENLKIYDSQQIHVSFEKCNNVYASNLAISASRNSPNTDGIHVTRTQNIQIIDCVIETGDDCISIETGSKSLYANNIVCGPGHGISIGSLGDNNSEAQVSNITIDIANLTGTTNGVRIKTWQGGSGYAKDIIFQNIEMNNVQNPIIIDQDYCDSDKPCEEQKSAVEVSNVEYKNIKGTSASKVAIKFNCSKIVPCHDILLEDINLSGIAKNTLCNNVKWTKKGIVVPTPCI